MRLRSNLVMALLVSLGCDPASKSAGQASEGDSAGPSTASCDAVVSAADFDGTCTENSDCVNVFEGPSTHECRECAFASVNAAEEEAYLSELGPESCSEAECAANCIASPGSRGACVDNACVVGRPFPCGEDSCNGLNEVCVFFGSDIVGEPGTFSCQTLPEACADAEDCACLAEQEGPPNWGFCVDLGSCEHNGSGFEVTCPGG